MGKRTQTLDRGTLPRRPAYRSRLFTVDVETGGLRVLLNEAAIWGLVRCLFLKLDTMYLFSCALERPTPLSILVRARLCCSVKGVVHSVVRDVQFLVNFSYGIAFISQNKNRLTSFRRKSFLSGHFEPVIETHKCWCSRFSTSLKKASFIASLIRQQFSAVLT